MYPSNFKGALLEYMVRRLLLNCGFIPVTADNLYTFENRGLFFVNGKGAAHDADVLMEPPIQMPFTYPSRILFECKAYEKKAGLSIIRNALGLRNDINDFEIVTIASIIKRQNNRRTNLAISDRKRHYYQVGVASVNEFSKPAVEFASNNKIFLLSLSWFLEVRSLELFRSINNEYINSIPSRLKQPILHYLKDRSVEAEYSYKNQQAKDYLNEDDVIGRIISSFEEVLAGSYVGLIETGDLIFLFPEHGSIDNIQPYDNFGSYRAQIHYYKQEPNIWLLSILNGYSENPIAKFRFFIPNRIMVLWKQYNLDKSKAIDIKQEFFSRIFIFNKDRRPEFPFFMVNIDRQWIERIRGD